MKLRAPPCSAKRTIMWGVVDLGGKSPGVCIASIETHVHTPRATFGRFHHEAAPFAPLMKRHVHAFLRQCHVDPRGFHLIINPSPGCLSGKLIIERSSQYESLYGKLSSVFNEVNKCHIRVGWWLVIGGWWRLVVGGWSPVAVGGGWRLAVGGSWRLVAVGGWRLVVTWGGP